MIVIFVTCQETGKGNQRDRVCEGSRPLNAIEYSASLSVAEGGHSHRRTTMTNYPRDNQKPTGDPTSPGKRWPSPDAPPENKPREEPKPDDRPIDDPQPPNSDPSDGDRYFQG